MEIKNKTFLWSICTASSLVSYIWNGLISICGIFLKGFGSMKKKFPTKCFKEPFSQIEIDEIIALA